MTVVIQIGNSDNKLTQMDWSDFVEYVGDAAGEFCDVIHFRGGSSFDSCWQNACWVIEIKEEKKLELLERLMFFARKFNQDSIAVTTGTTEFI